MSDFIWQWKNGDRKIYTKKDELAEEAMREGYFVMGIKAKPNIIKY